MSELEAWREVFRDLVMLEADGDTSQWPALLAERWARMARLVHKLRAAEACARQAGWDLSQGLPHAIDEAVGREAT